MKIYKPDQAHARAISRLEREELEEFPAAAPVEEFPSLDALVEEVDDLSGPELQSLRERMLEEARTESENAAKRAYEEGFALGREAGRAEFDASVAQAAKLLRSAASAIQASQERFLDSLEPQVLELTSAIAERIVRRELRSDPELVQRTVRQALEKIVERQRLRIQVNPQDLAALRNYRISLLEEFDGVDEVDIEARSSISPGGCIIETEHVQVDAQIETLLANVLETLAE